MLDNLMRPRIVPLMDGLAVKISQSGLTAHHITLIGFALGFVGCFLVGMQMYLPGLLFIVISLVFDGLDGAVARATKITELGVYLDMMASVILFAAFPFFFMLSSSNGDHTTAAAVLLFSFLLMGMANLAYDFFAIRKGAAPAKTGIVESGEIIVFMILCCLFPEAFSFFAAFLALISFAAAFVRMGLTIKLLKEEKPVQA